MKKISKLVIFTGIYSLLLALSSCATTSKTPDYKVESYVRTWPLGSTEQEQSLNNHWDNTEIKGNSLTELIISFAHIDPETWGIKFPDADNKEKPFPELWNEVKALKARYPALKVNCSVGGWGADHFSPMAADPEKKEKFIAALVNLLKEKDLDGIDIDWEYPVGPDWGQEIQSSPEDGKNFLSLLQDMRTAFDNLGKTTGKHYSISCAIPGSSWYVQKIDVISLSKLVDTMKLMSYDYYGGWSAQTGHHANLYNNPEDPDWGGWSTDQAVKMYLNAGVPASKIVIGVALYGRAWKGVEDNGVHGLYQKFAEPAYGDGLSWTQLKEFLKPGSGFTRYWDDVAKAPFLYNGDIFISYTDAEEIKLIGEYVKENGLGGVMAWEYGHDIESELIKALYNSVN